MSLNDADPTGDGDQTQLGLRAIDAHKDLFDASSQDVLEDLSGNGASQFAMLCTLGETVQVEAFLKSASNVAKGQDPSKPPEATVRLLETRETSKRLSPLVLIALSAREIHPESFPTNQIENATKDLLAVAALLLLYGARPDAKDICGKTVCHYGAGTTATTASLQVVDMCIAAAESSHLFGKEVELYDLTGGRNGKRGVARGFHADSGRRAVYLLGETKLVLAKPENIRLVGEAASAHTRPKLCDVQDRFGSVPLHGVCFSNRADVATFLLEKHGARLDIAMWDDGLSPCTIATSATGSLVAHTAMPIVIKHSLKLAHAEKKAAKAKCTKCQVLETADRPLFACARCMEVQYCCKKCQATDWKAAHKHKCVKLAAESKKRILLETPPTNEVYLALLQSKLCNWELEMPGSYRKPDSLATGEHFYIKVQDAPGGSLLISDKSRQCQFLYIKGLRGFDQLYDKVRKEETAIGDIVFLKASIDTLGNCTVYPGTATLKTW